MNERTDNPVSECLLTLVWKEFTPEIGKLDVKTIRDSANSEIIHTEGYSIDSYTL